MREEDIGHAAARLPAAEMATRSMFKAVQMSACAVVHPSPLSADQRAAALDRWLAECAADPDIWAAALCGDPVLARFARRIIDSARERRVS